MKNRVVFDTSFFSSFLMKRDVNHDKALGLFNYYVDINNIIMPTSVLMELEILPKSINKPDFTELIHEVLEMFELNFISLDHSFFKEFQKINSKITQKVKTLDLTILTTALLYDAELITFDKKLQKVYNQLINNKS